MCSFFATIGVLYPISTGGTRERKSVTYVVSPRPNEINLAGADVKLKLMKTQHYRQ